MYYGDLWMYAPALEKWTHVFPGGQGPQERAYHVAVSIPSGVMVFGGWRGNEFLNDVHVLTSSSGRTPTHEWIEMRVSGDVLVPRAYHTANRVGSKVYLFGGFHQGFLGKVDVLDVSHWTVSQANAFGRPPLPRAAHSTTAVGAQLYVFGGESEKGRLNDLHVFDTRSLSWTTPEVRGAPPSPRSGHSAVLMGHHIIFFGGWDGENHLNDLAILNLKAMAWVGAKELSVRNEGPSFRSGHSCVPLQNHNRFLVFGGWNHESFIRDKWILTLEGFQEPTPSKAK